MNKIPLEVMYNMNTYLSIKDLINIYSCTKYYSKTLKKTKSVNEFKNIFHTNNIFCKLTGNFSSERRKLFSKYFYTNIPYEINNITEYFKWVFIFHKILHFYNISFFSDNIILFTSRGKCSIFSICRHVIDCVRKKSNYGYNYNKPSRVLVKLATERNLTELSKNWYHQLTFKQFAELIFELSESI